MMKQAVRVPGSVPILWHFSVDRLWDAAILRPVARKLRVEYSGAIYHVTNRGDRRESIFEDDTWTHQIVVSTKNARLS